MAAVTSAIIGGAGLAMSAYQAYQGNKNAQEGKDALANYKRQDLAESNPYKNLQISTVGSDLMREESSRNMATAMSGINNAGTRAIIGGTPRLVAEQNNVNRNIQKELDDQVARRNFAIAQDQTAIRDLQENREISDLAGIGQQIQTGRQDMWSGIRGMGSSAMSLAQSGVFNGTPQVEGVEGVESFLKPVGLTPTYTNSLIPKAPSLPSFFKSNPLG